MDDCASPTSGLGQPLRMTSHRQKESCKFSGRSPVTLGQGDSQRTHGITVLNCKMIPKRCARSLRNHWGVPSLPGREHQPERHLWQARDHIPLDIHQRLREGFWVHLALHLNLSAMTLWWTPTTVRGHQLRFGMNWASWLTKSWTSRCTIHTPIEPLQFPATGCQTRTRCLWYEMLYTHILALLINSTEAGNLLRGNAIYLRQWPHWRLWCWTLKQKRQKQLVHAGGVSLPESCCFHAFFSF